MTWKVAFNSQMKSLGLTMASILCSKIRSATCTPWTYVLCLRPLIGQWNLKLVSQFHVETNRKFHSIYIGLLCTGTPFSGLYWLAAGYLLDYRVVNAPGEIGDWSQWNSNAADNSDSNNNFRFSINFSEILQEQGHTLLRHGGSAHGTPQG